jgi:hypothetical protein
VALAAGRGKAPGNSGIAMLAFVNKRAAIAGSSSLAHKFIAELLVQGLRNPKPAAPISVDLRRG